MIAQIDKEYIITKPTKLWSRLVNYGLFEGRPITTRGQWINPVLFKLFKMWEILPQLKEVEKPLFIIGTGRSGTTLLGTLLSIHKDISFLNEPKALWHEVYDKEDIIGSYTNGEVFYSLDEHVVDEVVKNRAKKLYGANLAVTRGKRILDKYPELIFRIPFVKKIFPDAKFLFITRNGNDALQSIHNWSERLGEFMNGEKHDWWGVNDRKWKLLCNQVIPESEYLKKYQSQISHFKNHKDRAAVEWILTMEKGIEIKADYSDCIFEIKYEELLTDYTDVLKQILFFSELPADEKLLIYADKVISKPKEKENILIHPLLKKPFSSLMEKYNYSSI